MSYLNIPAELRALPNFICWRYVFNDNEKPTKEPVNPHTGRLASVTVPGTWSTFEHAVSVASTYNGIGLVITDDCPFSCIDLDPTDDPEVRARHIAIAEAFPTYQEISPSGSGLHLWVKGKTPSNCNRKNVEIYTGRHYLTMTGNVYKPGPIQDHNELLNGLWQEITTTQNEVINSASAEEKQSDYEILKVASSAANAQKFIDLYEGRWQQYYNDDPKKVSCSEADYSLCNIIGHYTQNHAQIARIFRSSALGKRAKAQRDDYLFNPRYGIVIKALDRVPPNIDLDGLKNSLELMFAEQRKQIQEITAPVLAVQNVPQSCNIQLPELKPQKTVYEPPSGLTGAIARFIHASSPRPVPEIALAASLGLMSGIVGRAYNFEGLGLNNYILLLAGTGVGKESIAGGIDKLMNEVVKTVPDAEKFVGPSKIASEQALIKHLSKASTSFTSVIGEFGLELQRQCSPRANPNQIGLRLAFLELYGKSGHGKVYKPMIYSNKDNNTNAINGPAFSILGESTGLRFYEMLDENMIAEGYLPRFTIIEYTGLRAKRNKEHNKVIPDARLIEQLSALCAQAVNINNGNRSMEVGQTSEARAILDEYDETCDKRINESQSETVKHFWTRALVKVYKVAAVIAVGDNYINPVVSVDNVKWAINLIENDVNTMLEKFESGAVGAPVAQNEQAVDIQKAFKRYLKADWSDIEKYPGASQITHLNRLVPHSFITAYCRNRASFKADRLGPVNAIKTQLQSLLETGEIQELGPTVKAEKKLPRNGKLYCVSEVKWLK